MSDFIDDNHFEREVRRVSKIIWPDAPIDSSPIVDGLERDAMVQTRDLIYVIEATTSRRKNKTEYDLEKTEALVKKLQHQGFVAKGILVTLNEPTADQLDVVKATRFPVELQSFEAFLGRVCDASHYLQSRLNKPFGSIQNPRKSQHPLVLDRKFFVDVPLVRDDGGKTSSVAKIADGISSVSLKIVLLADFGSGKSMSLREIFFSLRERFLSKRHMRFPLFINLRDHAGARYPDEILERHARDLGIAEPTALVKAWRAGLVDLILDGFDEFTTTGWTAAPLKLRQIRHVALEAVRRLISESPAKTGIIIAGRQNFFDSRRELHEALGTLSIFEVFRIETLSEADAAKIVQRYGGTEAPDWVTNRALLLAYLAANDILGDRSIVPTEVASRGEGWDSLLKMICEREARQHVALTGTAVLSFLERLATVARQSNDGLGSFSDDDLAKAFQETCGFVPDDAARLLMSRLPGLASMQPDSGRRGFIDPDIADAARAGDIYRIIENPYDSPLLTALIPGQFPMRSNGLDRLYYLVHSTKVAHSPIEVATERTGLADAKVAAIDLLQLMVTWNIDYRKTPIYISDLYYENMTFDEEFPDLSKISFSDCVVDTLNLMNGTDIGHLPKFYKCLIGSLDGVATTADLPEGVFFDCEFDRLADSIARNAGILAIDLPLAHRVLLTVLNKLFIQSGRGRKENAFSRGLDIRARELVPEVLAAVESSGFAIRNRIRNQTIWLPRRDKLPRVMEIMDHPSTSKDPLVVRVNEL